MPTDAAFRLRPIPRSQWNRALAAHLLNRAGFGGSPSEIDEIYELGPKQAVSRLVDYASIESPPAPPPWAHGGESLIADPKVMRDLSEEERRQKRQELRRENQRRLFELRGWWLGLMRHSPRPLEEKLTLFWHGHFATSFAKVNSAYAMYLQNQTLRTHAEGSWAEMLKAISRDPAMLIYLDGARNRKSAPNENYAREVMELFTLGEGHYSEEDIRAAARAFAGWRLNRAEMTATLNKKQQDRGSKKFMGERGSFDEDDIIRIILEQPQAAEYIASRLWSFFAYRDPDPDLVRALGAHLRAQRYQFKPFLRTLFSSRAFYSGKAFRTQIKSPVQWLVSSVKYMEAPLPPPAVQVYMLDILGQRLFAPPNVAGWEGGETWITTASLLARYNLAAFLTEGILSAQGALAGGARQAVNRGIGLVMNPKMEEQAKKKARTAFMAKAARPVMDPEKVLPTSARTGRDEVREYLQWRFYQSRLRPQDVEAFETYFAALPQPAKWSDRHVRETVHILMSSPQFQLT